MTEDLRTSAFAQPAFQMPDEGPGRRWRIHPGREHGLHPGAHDGRRQVDEVTQERVRVLGG